MSCTTNKSLALIEYAQNWRCRLDNGTRIYCDTHHCDTCAIAFEGDADIAGIGVIIGFVATTWFTIIVASIRAAYQTHRTWPPWKQAANDQQEGKVEEVTAKLLDALCDLQAITGMAIVTAGLAQMPKISFYHQQFVALFWELTLTSFWAARSSYMQSDNATVRAVLRKFTVLSSVALYLVFASLTMQRENSMWDSMTSGRCYLKSDHTGGEVAIFWLCGTSAYALVLTLDLAQDVVHFFNEKAQNYMRNANEYIASRPRALLLASGQAERPVIQVLRYFSAGLLWLFINCVAVWSYGNCFYPFAILCYAGLAAWNTYDIIDLKIANQSLVLGSETDWKFGQVLPTAVLMFLAFGTVDALSELQGEKGNMPLSGNRLNFNRRNIR